MRREEREKWKSFLIAFILTLALLSCIMIAAVTAVQPSMPQSMQNTPATQQEAITFRPQASDTLTLVVIGANSSGASEFLLIRFNPQYGQVPLSLLPAKTLVTLNAKELTLAQAYAKGGGDAVKQGLSERLGIVVDRYAKLSSESFVRIAEKTGSVVFTLPYDISYQNKKGYTINIPAGERRLDAKDVADIFAYPKFQKDELEKSELLGNLIAAIVNQNMHAASDAVSSELFKLAVNLLDTDVTSADYEYRRDAANFVSQLNTKIAGSIAAEGTFLSDGKVFGLSESYIAQIQRYFQTAV
ncbi:LCP family protein [Oscillospiraceae bacterium PP1C4]